MNKNYIDITKEMLINTILYSYEVQDLLYFEDKNGKIYYVDGKNVILDSSPKEKEIAKLLVKVFGGKLFILPRVNKPDGIKSADYLWNNEFWDLKEIKSSGKRVIDNRIRGAKKQSCNFILDITDNELSNQAIIKQVEKIYESKGRKWVNKIIIIKNEKLIKAFKRK